MKVSNLLQKLNLKGVGIKLGTWTPWMRHAFSNFSNWIVPGHVMLGRYPYVEPAHCHSKLEGEQQMAMLISAGITTFVSLQEELPPQHALRSSGANGFLPYKATAELLWHNNVAGHHSRQQVTSISSAGTGHLDIIGDNREEELGIVIERPTTIHHQPLPNIIEREMSEESQRGLRFIHAPIVDLGILSTEDLRSLLVQLTDLILMKREKLYIHCWGGCGRAGMVGTALLVTAYSVPVEEALERVQRGFYTRNGKSHKTCPETAEQFQFLRQFLLDYN
ncbi:hypothetical protein CEUSTIGMA_g2676.t1 [Chlamydomonas eustigma]|uniref:Tyrosine specific protein phosphatases domain-containing protein n=1 Tax=Chlamydomonas eustigma TaxID=1157962 RepID=A0A250WWN7_9CHLO|nr:hypothetical protein CEUSTIGMA_g2676.t1 [Chlamydomonas eustigma]|eukprot:GAX75231.1 hypothetical protein CEUSTIGMA_g2676.t1 [Chlamydomonas eustigma]